MKTGDWRLCRKEEVPMLVVLGLVLAGTIFFMRAPERKEAGPELKEHDLLWVRGYLTNLQAGHVNEMAVDSVRLSKESVLPILVKEMDVRPPTIGKKLNDRVESILAEFPALQRPARVPDGYRAAAVWALQMLYRGPQEERYRAATEEEGRMLLPVLASALYDNAVMVRAHAADALGAFDVRREDALALCSVALDDSEWMVRMGGLNSLVALTGFEPASMDVVKARLKDSHPEVRRRARALLIKAGMPLPEEAEEEEALPVASYTFE
jgi:hypothetical protein